MPAKKTVSQLRDNLRSKVYEAAVNKGVQLTDELKARLEEVVLKEYPYGKDELKGFRTEVILTMEEIVAAAVSIDLVDISTAQDFINSKGGEHGHLAEVRRNDATTGEREFDVFAHSPRGELGVRTSVTRVTQGTDWFKYGLVFLYRPFVDHAAKKADAKVEGLLDSILED